MASILIKDESLSPLLKYIRDDVSLVVEALDKFLKGLPFYV
jgi:hypothetical protein